MKILLDGYFDKNFGDDVMQLLVVNGLKQHDFYVCFEQREMLAHLENISNVHITDSVPKVDAYVNVIGTGFLCRGRKAALFKLFDMLEKRKRYNISAVVNCSIEPIASGLPEFVTVTELKRYGYFSCRDAVSYEYIVSRCPNSAAVMHQDIVFSLPRLYDIPPKQGGCLGVSLVRRLYSSENYKYYKAVAECCDYFAEKENKPSLLFAFDSGLENDISAALSVKGMMKHPDMTEIIVYNSEPAELLKGYARCSRFVGSRFHSIVTAALCGVPAVAVCDSRKLELLCAQYAVPAIKRSDITAEAVIAELLRADTFAVISDDIMADAAAHITDLNAFLMK